jgi:oligopeptide transport system ATP-binding protein
MNDGLLSVRGLVKHYRVDGKLVRAVDGIDFNVYEGETFSLVGESGCGKTSAALATLRLHEPTDGQILFDGRDIRALSRRQLKALRKEMQIIFQDPYASLNPRMTVLDIVGEGLDIHRLATGQKRTDRVVELLERVGLRTDALHRYPHEFSGGQRQRIGIARALAPDPRFLVCDEPTSALDLSVQAQVINLLKSLQRDMNLTYLFISHDLAVVRHVSDRLGVMYRGHIVERAPVARLFTNPHHPYTQALLAAVPIPDPSRSRPRPTLYSPPLTKKERPAWRQVAPGHSVACHL